jgi:hypothetical protein
MRQTGVFRRSITVIGKALWRPARRWGVTWADLFARAERYDCSEADVTDALRRHRTDDAD